jgi:hypothetical protein
MSNPMGELARTAYFSVQVSYPNIQVAPESAFDTLSQRINSRNGKKDVFPMGEHVEPIGRMSR